MMQLVAQQIRALKNDEQVHTHWFTSWRMRLGGQVGEMKQLERYVEAKKLQFTMERNEAMAAKLEADLALHQVPYLPVGCLVRAAAVCRSNLMSC